MARARTWVIKILRYILFKYNSINTRQTHTQKRERDIYTYIYVKCAGNSDLRLRKEIMPNEVSMLTYTHARRPEKIFFFFHFHLFVAADVAVVVVVVVVETSKK